MKNAPNDGALETSFAASFSPYNTQENLLTQALAIAAQGYAVFPCNDDRTPACRSGFKSASCDQAEVTHLFKAAQGAALIGIATGDASGIAVLDVDFKNGAAAWFEENKEKIPQNYFYLTPSGGFHYWFKHREGLRCSIGKIAKGIDVRADGGYIIFWPAVGLPILNNAPLAQWPDWLDSETPPPFTKAAPEKVGYAYAQAALKRAVDNIANAPEGERNSTLNSETYTLLRFSPLLEVERIVNAIAVAALQAGLTPNEIQKTLASALRAKGF